MMQNNYELQTFEMVPLDFFNDLIHEFSKWGGFFVPKSTQSELSYIQNFSGEQIVVVLS